MPDPKEKSKKLYIKPKSTHKGIVNGAKENTFRDFSNRVLSPILNHVNHSASNGVETHNHKQPIEQNGKKINGQSVYDHRTIVQKLNEYRKCIR